MMSHLLWPLGRYVGFAYSTYYPEGGFNDCIGSYDTLEIALEDLADKQFHSDFRYVVDTQTGIITKLEIKP